MNLALSKLESDAWRGFMAYILGVANFLAEGRGPPLKGFKMSSLAKVNKIAFLLFFNLKSFQR